MSIDRDGFTDECVLSGVYCGVLPHYLAAVAELRSGTQQAKDGDLIGPFKLTRDQWNANRTDDDLEVDVSEQKMDRWEYHPIVFSIMTARALARFGTPPSGLDLLKAEFPGNDSAGLASDLQNAFAATATAVKDAWTRVIGTPIPPSSLVTDPNVPASPANGKIRLTSIPATRRPMAQRIIGSFAAAGFGTLQQVAAVANAKAESGLNPAAHAGVGEDSWGLFQLNRKGGLGQGHSPDELKDPDVNIAIIIREAIKVKDFVGAVTLEGAVNAFVRSIERPLDRKGQIVARISIAQQLLA